MNIDEQIQQQLSQAKADDQKNTAVHTLYQALKHGDRPHQQWLYQAILAFSEGKPVAPAPPDHRAAELLLLRDFFDQYVHFHTIASSGAPRSSIESAAQRMVDCKQAVMNYRDPAQIKPEPPKLVVDNTKDE